MLGVVSREGELSEEEEVWIGLQEVGVGEAMVRVRITMLGEEGALAFVRYDYFERLKVESRKETVSTFRLSSLRQVILSSFLVYKSSYVRFSQ